MIRPVGFSEGRTAFNNGLGFEGPKRGVQPNGVYYKHDEEEVSGAGGVGGENDSEIKNLIKALKDPDPDVCRDAVYALREIGPEAVSAVPALIEALKDPNANVRCAAAYVLGHIGPETVSAVPALIAALNDPNANVREQAAYALRKIERGKTTSPAIAPLTTVSTDDPEPHVRMVAKAALRQINPELT